MRNGTDTLKSACIYIAAVSVAVGTLVLAGLSHADTGGGGTPACIQEKPRACSQSGGSFCQGTVTACTQGWGNSTSGFTCPGWSVQLSKCFSWTGCAPGASNGGPPPGHQDVGCAEQGGQTCYCKTLLTTFDGTEWFVMYNNCVSCP